jgi:ABC-type Fe3+-hydroxamate transport system substrate-binding protein
VGGTKSPSIDRILALQPDLVIANREENARTSVESLERAGVRVLLQFPRSVDQALDSLYQLAGLFRHQPAMLGVETLARAVDYARAAAESASPVRYFCPIWYAEGAPEGDWWMVFNRDTYASDLLEILGGQNVFADRQRRYPLAADLGQAAPQDSGDKDVRYPRVTAREVEEADPDLILLLSEPFEFSAAHLPLVNRVFSGTTAVNEGRVRLVDGSLATWHGVRMAQALRLLPGLLAA